jgi:putative Mg2+ transporter-C (MgtC) family protein
VCVAAATFAILTIEIIHAPVFGSAALGDAVKVDPVRVVEAVTAGVAFLAAGVVIFTKGQVHGLTTGAGMWLAGAIGLACGLGLWQIAAFSALIALIVLGLLQTLEKSLDLDKEPDFGLDSDKREAAQRAIRPKEDDPSRMDPGTG